MNFRQSYQQDSPGKFKLESDVSSLENDRGVTIVRPSESEYDLIAQQEFLRNQQSRNVHTSSGMRKLHTVTHINQNSRPISSHQSQLIRFKSRPLSGRHMVQHRPFIHHPHNDKAAFNFEIRNSRPGDSCLPRSQMQIYSTMARVNSQQNLAKGYLFQKSVNQNSR